MTESFGNNSSERNLPTDVRTQWIMMMMMTSTSYDLVSVTFHYFVQSILSTLNYWFVVYMVQGVTNGVVTANKH